MNTNSIDITDQRYGRLTAIRFDHRTPDNNYYWLFRCDCGKEKVLAKANVMHGKTSSCGCYHRENQTVHGDHGSSLYYVWNAMKQRCNNPNDKGYKNYGGRGISVCKRWYLYKNFKDDMYDAYQQHIAKYGQRQTSIERVNNNRGYTPSNCRWATRKEQAQNQRRPRRQIMSSSPQL